jgi:DNA-binding response OmpR family regulator
VRNVSETAVPVLVDDKARAGELRACFAPGLCPFDVDALGEQPLVEAISRFRPRLILLNPTVGGLDVPEVCRFLRDVARIPFVFVSPVADPEGVIAGLELGADDYVIKPYDPRELAARVGAVLRRYATNRAACESLDGENSTSSVPAPFGVVAARSRRDRLKDRAALVARKAWAGGRRPLHRSD